MKRHRLDPISLVLSILFLAFGVRYLAAGADLGAFSRPGWLLPLGVIIFGVGVIASAARAGRARREGVRQPEEPHD